MMSKVKIDLSADDIALARKALTAYGNLSPVPDKDSLDSAALRRRLEGDKEVLAARLTVVQKEVAV